MKTFLWFIKQLFPLDYYSVHERIEDCSGRFKAVTVWKMWFGKCYKIRNFKILEEI
jgi:hypothetical protein